MITRTQSFRIELEESTRVVLTRELLKLTPSVHGADDAGEGTGSWN